jgi:hypothetical protein
MDVEAQIAKMNERVEQIWSVLQQWPNNVGLASNLEPGTETRRFKRSTSKEDIRQALIKQWNKIHPQYKVTK